MMPARPGLRTVRSMTTCAATPSTGAPSLAHPATVMSSVVLSSCAHQGGLAAGRSVLSLRSTGRPVDRLSVSEGLLPEANIQPSRRALSRSTVITSIGGKPIAYVIKFPVPVVAPATTTDAATVRDGDTPSYMTCKDPRTMQHPALSTVAVDAAETLEDEFLARAADGVICANDILHIRPLIRLAVAHAQASDLATMAGLAVIRGGKESQRASRLLREVDTFVPQEAA